MCYTPQTIYRSKNGDKSVHTVPCGKCPKCCARRISQWSFRLMQEHKVATSSYFITLIYDTQHVPITQNRYMSVVKRDVQLFFKRLRRAHGKKYKGGSLPLKYYCAAEYGELCRRPHYHIILFNADISLIQPAWSDPQTGKHLGAVHFGGEQGVCEASVGYTLKYISKPKWKRQHQRDDRAGTFALMSKGLGAAYVTAKTIRFHNDLPNERMCLKIPFSGGKLASMPRYYKDRIYDWHTRNMIAAHFRGEIEKATDKMETYVDRFGNLKFRDMRARDQSIAAAFFNMHAKARKGGIFSKV